MKEACIYIFNYINTLSLIDIAIFCVLMVLAILIISLINTLKGYYLVKKPISNKENIEEERDVIINIEEVSNNNETFDINAVTEELKEAAKLNIALTPYEEEQEEKAIISYDELLKAKSDLKLNYDNVEDDNGVVVKKVNMENMTSFSLNEEEKTDTVVRVISYEKEEEFLKSLKQLQQLLNS